MLENASKYYIEISTDNNFIDDVASYSDIIRNSFTFDTKLNPWTYYLRVRGENEMYQGPWSEIITVIVKNTEISPSLIRSCYDSWHCFEKDISFTWDAPSFLVSYHVQVAEDKEFTKLVLDN